MNHDAGRTDAAAELATSRTSASAVVEAPTVRLPSALGTPRMPAEPPPPPVEPGPPRSVGPYLIQETLARGGMGVVYRAIDTRLKRMVALKMILAGGHACASTLIRFRAEAEAVARLQHPNIVQIFEVGEHDGLPYLALEYVEGRSLSQTLKGKPLAAREAADLTRALAQAVEFAHERGIVHRDIKPGNILLTPQGVPKITDFGVAKLKGAADTFSQPGEVLGTPNYMAPEQADGNSGLVGPVADVYSLGAVLYELTTGVPPFDGGTPMETLMRLKMIDPVRPRHYNPTVPPDLETICLKCLAKTRHHRYPSAAELAEDLQRFLDRRPIQARPVGLIERVRLWASRHPGIAVIASTLAVCLMVSYASIIYQWRLAKSAEWQVTLRGNQLSQLERELAIEKSELQAARAKADDATHRAEWIAHVSKMNDAHRELLLGNPASALEMLESTQDRRHSWAWRFLRRQVEGSSVSVELDAIEALALAHDPGGHHVLTVNIHGEVVTRDYASAEPVRKVKLAEKDGLAIARCQFSPDARTIAGVCVDGQKPANRTLAVWESATGKRLGSWPLAPGDILSLAVSAEGTQIVVVTGMPLDEHGRRDWLGGSVQVFFVGQKTPAWQISLPANEPSWLAAGVQPRTGRVILARRDTPWSFFDGPTGKNLGAGKAPGIQGRAIAVNHTDGAFAVLDGKSIAMFDAAGTPGSTLREPGGYITNAAFSVDGASLVTCNTEKLIRIWDIKEVRVAATLAGHHRAVSAAVLSPDNTRLVSYANDRKLKIWALPWEDVPGIDTRSGREWTPSIAFGPDMKWLVSGSGDGQLIVWDTQKGRRIRTIRTRHAISHLSVKADGSLVAVAFNKSPHIEFWDPESGEHRGSLDLSGPANRVVFDPKQNRVLAACENGDATIWDVDERKMVIKLAHGQHEINCAKFDPSGRQLAIADESGVVTVYDAKSGQELRRIAAHDTPASCLAFSPDGRTLATANQNRSHQERSVQVKTWDAASGSLLREFPPQDQSIWCLAFSPDGDVLASAGEDKRVRIWSTNMAQVMLTLNGHSDDVRCLVFSADGNVLVSSGDDNFIRFWDASPVEKGPGVKAGFLAR